MHESGGRPLCALREGGDLRGASAIDMSMQARRKVKAGFGRAMDDEIEIACESRRRLAVEAKPVLANIALDREHCPSVGPGPNIGSGIDNSAVIAAQLA